MNKDNITDSSLKSFRYTKTIEIFKIVKNEYITPTLSVDTLLEILDELLSRCPYSDLVDYSKILNLCYDIANTKTECILIECSYEIYKYWKKYARRISTSISSISNFDDYISAAMIIACIFLDLRKMPKPLI